MIINTICLILLVVAAVLFVLSYREANEKSGDEGWDALGKIILGFIILFVAGLIKLVSLIDI